eukprot:CAMPEP_0194374178 /NCGR_PEP_ID=MMETSP0174-20130528/22556_1 /TAXON_ID=216777 /ORGANISM="Proboscia alata, Strain PI-D3" /LENGTH=49 /DNA_ID= /DNA_START= /DNA_END= /DNA_ORIENTATION=
MYNKKNTNNSDNKNERSSESPPRNSPTPPAIEDLRNRYSSLVSQVDRRT